MYIFNSISERVSDIFHLSDNFKDIVKTVLFCDCVLCALLGLYCSIVGDINITVLVILGSPCILFMLLWVAFLVVLYIPLAVVLVLYSIRKALFFGDKTIRPDGRYSMTVSFLGLRDFNKLESLDLKLNSILLRRPTDEHTDYYELITERYRILRRNRKKGITDFGFFKETATYFAETNNADITDFYFINYFCLLPPSTIPKDMLTALRAYRDICRGRIAKTLVKDMFDKFYKKETP